MILGPLRSPEAEAISASMLSETLWFWGTCSPSVDTNIELFSDPTWRAYFLKFEEFTYFLPQSVELVGTVEKPTFLRVFCTN